MRMVVGGLIRGRRAVGRSPPVLLLPVPAIGPPAAPLSVGAGGWNGGCAEGGATGAHGEAGDRRKSREAARFARCAASAEERVGSCATHRAPLRAVGETDRCRAVRGSCATPGAPLRAGSTSAKADGPPRAGLPRRAGRSSFRNGLSRAYGAARDEGVSRGPAGRGRLGSSGSDERAGALGPECTSTDDRRSRARMRDPPKAGTGRSTPTDRARIERRPRWCGGGSSTRRDACRVRGAGGRWPNRGGPPSVSSGKPHGRGSWRASAEWLRAREASGARQLPRAALRPSRCPVARRAREGEAGRDGGGRRFDERARPLPPQRDIRVPSRGWLPSARRRTGTGVESDP